MYRAPEIIMKREYTQAVDVWSFGILLLSMLLGKPFSKVYRESDHKVLMVDILETFGCSLLYGPILDWISLHDIPFWNFEKPVMALEQLILSEHSSIASPKIFDIPDTLKAACDLIRKCTILDPEKRATWSDILHDSFWNLRFSAVVPAKPACSDPLGDSHLVLCEKLFTSCLRKHLFSERLNSSYGLHTISLTSFYSLMVYCRRLSFSISTACIAYWIFVESTSKNNKTNHLGAALFIAAAYNEDSRDLWEWSMWTSVVNDSGTLKDSILDMIAQTHGWYPAINWNRYFKTIKPFFDVSDWALSYACILWSQNEYEVPSTSDFMFLKYALQSNYAYNYTNAA
jgi:serine/threonine protein kinase